MGRSFAGILGPVAFMTVLGRGLLARHAVESTLLVAWFALLAFSAIGYVAGSIAGWIVDQSVRDRFAAELATQDASLKRNDLHEAGATPGSRVTTS